MIKGSKEAVGVPDTRSVSFKIHPEQAELTGSDYDFIILLAHFRLPAQLTEKRCTDPYKRRQKIVVIHCTRQRYE
jgi:hypothetical protein